MTPLPVPPDNGRLRLWRLDRKRHAARWEGGEGGFQVGGRWNNPGLRAVCAATDPAGSLWPDPRPNAGTP